MSFNRIHGPALAALRAELDRPRRIAIVSHHNPDGDAVGSALGLMHVLRTMGHTVRVALPNRPPDFLQWMPGYSEVACYDVEPSASEAMLRESEILFCLDFNKPDRVKGLEAALRAAPFRVLVDHHQEPEDFTAITFSDTTACATCQLVHDIVLGLGAEDHIQADAATCLYAGIMTDSGSFRFNSTTAHTLEVASSLMRRGAVPDRIVSAILDDNTESRLRLLGFALSERMEVHMDLGIVVFALSKADLKRFNYKAGDTEGLVNYGLSMRGIRLAAFFMERENEVKVSLRSKGAVAVDRITRAHFNGGGHTNAAGGQTTLALRAAVDHFMQVVPDHIKSTVS